MNVAEARSLLEEVSAIDNRKLSTELVTAWHKIIGHVDYKVAERALVLARRDAAITYLEPKHIVSKLPFAIAELNEELKSSEIEEKKWKSDPEPKCRPHAELITHCMDCCRTLSRRAKAYPRDDLHKWAVENLYIDERVPF